MLRFVVLTIVAFPTAGATIAADAVVAEVFIDDERPANCGPAGHLPCLFTHDPGPNSTLGDDEVELYQTIKVARVTVRPSNVPAIGGLLVPLLPDEDLSVDAHTIRAHHPLLRSYNQTHRTIVSFGLEPPVDIDTNETGSSLERPMYPMVWFPHGSDGDFYGYDWVRPPVAWDLHGSDRAVMLASECGNYDVQVVTDASVPTLLSDACAAVEVPRTAQAITATVPSVAFGSDIQRIEVQTAGEGAAASGVEFAPSLDRKRPAQDIIRTPSGAGFHPMPPPIEASENPESARVGPIAAGRPARNGGMGVASAAAPAHSYAWVSLATITLLLAALYQRLLGKDLLLNAKRRALVDLVRARPGVSLVEAGQHIGTDHRGADHHVRKLERAGLLVARRAPGRVELYLPGATPPRVGDADAAIAHPLARRLLLEVARRNGATRRELRERLAEPRQTVEWHVRRLVAAGVLADAERGPVRIVPHRREAVLDVVLGFERAVRAPAARAPVAPASPA